ncbi:MAG: BRO-N domain-containing protein, partial [Cetobacterium sp.]
FIGKDIATMLGYSNSSTSISENVKQMQKKKIYVKTIENTGYSEIPKNANINMITEIGLYQLVMRSNLDSAEEFQQWVYEEVLPSFFVKKNKYLRRRRACDKRAVRNTKRNTDGCM